MFEHNEGISMQEGDTVMIQPGATRWLKERGHWADYIPQEIDGMTGTIEKNLTWLGGNARFRIDLGFQHPVSVPACFIGKVSDAT